MKPYKEAIELIANLEGCEVTIESAQNNIFFILPNNTDPMPAMILRQKRIDNGLSIRAVARRLGQSSPNSYGRCENGKSMPTIEKFDELLAALDPGLSNILRVASIDGSSDSSEVVTSPSLFDGITLLIHRGLLTQRLIILNVLFLPMKNTV